MTITLDIRPEVQAKLARQAALQGRAIESVAAPCLKAPCTRIRRATGGRDLRRNAVPGKR